MCSDETTRKLLKQWFRRMTLLVGIMVIVVAWFIAFIAALSIESNLMVFAWVVLTFGVLLSALTCPEELISAARIRFKHSKIIQKLFY